MKIRAKTIAVLMFALAGPASAGGMIDTFCGAGHVNETADAGDVRANPDGYYIASLGVQLSHGDPRIVKAVGSGFHLCTRGAATPDMERSRALLLMGEREVKYLFVPNDCPKGRPAS
jgi:hypothetical protein